MSELVTDILKAKNTIIEQLESQDYNVDAYKAMTDESIMEMIDNKQLDIHVKNKFNNNGAYILFQVWTKTIRQPNITEYIDIFYSNDDFLTVNDTLVIVSLEPPNESITNFLNNIYDRYGIYIIIHGLQNLTVNILNHSLVPKHIILNQEQIDQICLEYNSSIKGFSNINRNDPVAKCILLKPNQMVEIHRPSKTSIVSKYYRVCI